MNSGNFNFSHTLSRCIHSEIQNNPKTLAFSFVVNQEDNTAEIITTNKFTSLLNQELIKQLTQIVTTGVEQPTTVKEAEEKFKVYKINLPPMLDVASISSRMEEDLPSPHMVQPRVFTPGRRNTPIARMSPVGRMSPRNSPVNRTSPRMSPCTPLTHGPYAQLEPDMVIPRMPNPSMSPTKRARTQTPHGKSHQTLEPVYDYHAQPRYNDMPGKHNSEE